MRGSERLKVGGIGLRTYNKPAGFVSSYLLASMSFLKLGWLRSQAGVEWW